MQRSRIHTHPPTDLSLGVKIERLDTEVGGRWVEFSESIVNIFFSIVSISTVEDISRTSNSLFVKNFLAQIS